MKAKRLKKLLLLFTLIITLGIAITIPKEVNAMEKSELITIAAEDFIIYDNDLIADINGDLSGTIQFRYTYNYRIAHANTNIYVGGYGLNNYTIGFETYNTDAGDYDIFNIDRISYNSMTFVAIDYYTEDEYPKTITPPPNGTFDIIIGDDSVNATTMEPGFPETTSEITIVLTYTIDPSESTNPFTGYNINNSKPINDFKFYVYESDYYDGYNDGVIFGASMGEQQGYIYGYNTARQEFGYFDPITSTWLDYVDGFDNGYDVGYDGGYDVGIQDGAYDIFKNGIFDSAIDYINPDTGLPYNETSAYDYIQGFNVEAEAAYNQGLIDGANGNFMADFDTWIVPAIIIVLIGGGFIAFAKMRNKGD